MTRPIPVDVLARLESHERWQSTYPKQGTLLEWEDADLHELDLSHRNLMDAVLPGANLDGALLRSTNLSGVNLAEASLVRAVLDGANLGRAE
ncbi:MAG TPA: pentapeptide repeat-containing protein, partial [Ktedonobacteraceae bacterium]|nr:pentapeptide repeat-containing protein [Ktedonobacteraceae bacterium]